MDHTDLPHIVIGGGGFGGLSTAKVWRRAPVRVTLVDRRNFHLRVPFIQHGEYACFACQPS